jgi:hypothetical protein
MIEVRAMLVVALRILAQVTALRRHTMAFALTWARHVVSCYLLGPQVLSAEARKLLALGWQ